MMKWGSALFSLPVIVLLCQYGWEMSLVTECTESGLYFDFNQSECTENEPLSPNPYYARNTVWVNVMMLVSLTGALLMTWGMVKKGMTREE